MLTNSKKAKSEARGNAFCPWPLAKKGLDYSLLFTVLAMIAFGLIMVYSASFIHAQERTGDGYAFIKKQIFFAITGIALLYVATRVNYRKWSDWAYPIMGIATFLLVLVMIPGVGMKAGGAQRWFRLGFVHFQPGELAKLAILFFVARQLEVKSDRLDKFGAGILSNFLVPLPALILLLLQPDFGTTVMTVVVIFCLLFVAGVPKRFLFATLVLAGIAAAMLILGTEYRRARLVAFWDPWSDPGGRGFQIIQSLLGLYKGNIFGVGLGNGKEKLFYLPEAHNDFIMAVIGEELGLVGFVSVVLAFIYFLYRGLHLSWMAWRRFQDRFGFLLGVAITLSLGLQGLVNIAVVLGLVPTKGLNLPFISYGGSALLVNLFAVGVLLSIGRGPDKKGHSEQKR